MKTAAAVARVVTPHAPALIALEGAAFFRITGLILAVIQAAASRNSITSDGVAYLDVGDAFLRGDWSVAVNGSWSPLYPWLLAVGRAVVSPRRYNEYALAHCANLAAFGLAMAAFEFFLRRWLASTHSRDSDIAVRPRVALSYGLFLWGSLGMIGLAPVTPDLLGSVFVYLAAGLLVVLANRGGPLSRYALLGAVLGAGYWTRAPLFLLALPFLVPLYFARSRRRHKGIAGFLAAATVFALLALPLVLALSIQKGRFTFSESGRLNYAWYVAGVSYRHWQGEPVGTNDPVVPVSIAQASPAGVPVNPDRQLLSDPPVFEFGEPLACTYPVWCDPSYWYEGVESPFDLSRQLMVLVRNLDVLRQLVIPVHLNKIIPGEHSLRAFSTFAAILLLVCAVGRIRENQPAKGNAVILPAALAGLLAYLAVYVEARYVAVYLVLLYLSLFSFVRIPRWATVWTVAAFLVCALPQPIRQTYSLLTSNAETEREWTVAKEMLDSGLASGDRIAVLSYANVWHVRWARLARLRIVSELYGGASSTDPSSDESLFWTVPSDVRKKVIAAFRRAGAKAVVSRTPPIWAPTEGWRPVQGTGHSLLLLAKN